jgi:hypothetical protein
MVHGQEQRERGFCGGEVKVGCHLGPALPVDHMEVIHAERRTGQEVWLHSLSVCLSILPN